MRVLRAITMVAMVNLCLVQAPSSEAQTQPPWPDGCSIKLPLFVQQGLDGIFFTACTKHDLCWGRCNGPSPPYLDLEHKVQCDFLFLLDMEAACAAWSAVISYSGSGWSDAEDFLADCSAVAAMMAAAVSQPLGTITTFWRSQCTNGCNPDGCANSDAVWNPECGVSRCYSNSFPQPSPPTQPRDSCYDPNSQLTTLVVEGDPQVAAALAPTSYPLLRHERRDGFRYRMEEWAVLGVEVGNGREVDVEVRAASSSAYGSFQSRVLGRSLPVAAAGSAGRSAAARLRLGRSVVLLVNEPEHAHDERWIPAPELRWTPPALPVAGADGLAVVRADYAEDRSLIDFAVLDADRPLSQEEREAIRDGLDLAYASDAPHRVVVYAVVRLGSAMALVDALTVLPRCCLDPPDEY